MVEKGFQGGFCVARAGYDCALGVLESSIGAPEELRIIWRIAASLACCPAVVQALQGGVRMKIHLQLLIPVKPTNPGLGVIDPDNCVMTIAHVKAPPQSQ